MLFSHLPWWANIIALAVILVIKYFIIGFIEKSPAYQTRMSTGKGWMAINNVEAGLNGIVTAAILFFLGSLFWALALGILDAAIHWLVGYWKVKKMFPKISDKNIATAQGWFTSAKTWIATLHIASYAGIASWVVEYATGHANTWSTLLSIFHAAAPAAGG